MIKTLFIQSYMNWSYKRVSTEAEVMAPKICRDLLSKCMSSRNLESKENQKTHILQLSIAAIANESNTDASSIQEASSTNLSIPTSVKSMITADLNETYVHSLHLM